MILCAELGGQLNIGSTLTCPQNPRRSGYDIRICRVSAASIATTSFVLEALFDSKIGLTMACATLRSCLFG
jgi:hypothetical protein